MTPRIFVGAVERTPPAATDEEAPGPPRAGDAIAAPLAGTDYRLSGPEARHVAQALRMRVGQPLTLFTGTGGEYSTTITRIDRRDVVVRVERHDAIERESPCAVTLAQAVIAADMMDLVVRKAVELGVAAIAPVRAKSRARSGFVQRIPCYRPACGREC